MARSQNLTEMSDRVCCSEERAVQPTTTLTDELRQGLRHIRFSDSTLDVFKQPIATVSAKLENQRLCDLPVGLPLSHKFETQDTLQRGQFESLFFSNHRV